jgi:hypothetical protein
MFLFHGKKQNPYPGSSATGIRIAKPKKKTLMNRLLMFFALGLALAACGTHDNKNEVENYPTYDTAQRTEHINDSVSSDGMRSGGNLRNNIDGKEEKTR